MTSLALARAMTEARRFLKACDALNDRLSREEIISGCKEAAAVRRASMDLSRALADLRKP